jgi:hypothetical protein
MRHFRFHLLALLACLLMLGGCTQEQVDRAEAAVATAKDILARAESAEAQAVLAVEAARALADQIGNEQAKAIVAKAEAALATVQASTETAALAVNVAEKSAATAKAAQAAGGSTVDVLLAVLATAVPAVGAFIPLIRKLATTGKALAQTVKGVQAARGAIGEEGWKRSVAPALEAAQDEAVKAEVGRILAVKG